jgi:hypothetical protein
MNTSKFAVVESESDFDRIVASKVINGRFTKKRFKKIYAYCRKHFNQRKKSSSMYDCDGSLCNMNFDFIYSVDSITIRVVTIYNF